ncbi:MAG: umuC3, partial [Spirosoma sp.]|nr:umuC3 [Spirosoma sp.]
GYAQAALKAIFRFGYIYQKVGIILSDLVPNGHQQRSLFTELPDERLEKLSKVMDTVKQRYGRDRLRLASAGYDPTWHHRRAYLSPCYTTNWKDILKVK